MWYFASPDWADNIALENLTQQLTYQELANAVKARQTWLQAQHVQRVAIAMDNSIEWVLFDLACQQAGICCVPVPGFFSPTQTSHLLEQSAIELLLTERTNEQGDNNNVQASPFKHIDATHFTIESSPENTGWHP